MIIATLAIGEDFKRALAPSLSSKVEYAAKHGYTYVQGGTEFWDRTRPIPWSKVGFVLHLLKGAPEGSFIFLSDADVLITNPEFRLESLTELIGDKDLLMTLDACNNLNSGNMLLRNTAWQRDFWRRVGEQTAFTYHIWWENAAIIHLMKNPSDLAMIEVTDDCKKFNAYLYGDRALWSPGDFLVHFAGVYDLKKMITLQETIKSMVKI
jgi:hypothetical protein